MANPIKNFIGNANRVSEIDLDQEYQPNQDSHTDNDVYLGIPIITYSYFIRSPYFYYIYFLFQEVLLIKLI